MSQTTELPSPASAPTTSPPPGQSAWMRPVAPAARVVDAVKVYGSSGTEVRALDDVSVEFPRGRFTAIMGPSGSGKSTLMHCLAGLDTLSSGRVEHFVHSDDGVGPTPIDLGSLSDRQLTRLRRERVGFVFQAFNLLPTLSASENITLPLTLAGRRIDRDWMRLIVETVGLDGRLSHRPSELSGGQQQRVAVARALVSKPDIIFADEPTGNLDSRTGAEILTFMRYAVDAFEQSIVMVTHDPGAASYADHVVFLADGRIVDRIDAPTPERILDTMKAL